MTTRVTESARRERHAFERSFAVYGQVFRGKISSDSVMDIVQITRTKIIREFVSRDTNKCPMSVLTGVRINFREDI